jgi:anti-anti-sigma factor
VNYAVTQDAGPVILTAMTGRDGNVVVALEGDLDIASVPTVREQLLGLLRPGASRLVIDMSAVRYADASGLAVLVSTRRRAVLLGGELRLAAPGPEVAAVLNITGLSRHLATYPTLQSAVSDRRPSSRAALAGTGPSLAAQALPAQARGGPGADSGELHAAVAALLASADAWRDADPRRRFSAALRALAQAEAGTSYPALVRAARFLLYVLGREPLTYSPVVAATASRLRRLFPARPQLIMG